MTDKDQITGKLNVRTGELYDLKLEIGVRDYKHTELFNMDKLQQLRTLVKKRHDENWEKRNNKCNGNLCLARAFEYADILAIIDSIPRFKVGDVIKSGSYTYTIKDIDEDSYILDGNKVLTFNAQYDWELVEESQRMISAKAKEAGYSKPASEDLEEAAKKYADEEEYGDDVYYSIKATFKEGANWQKEQMMKGAVDAEVTYGKSLAIPSLGYFLDKNEMDVGDKVKLIIIKSE